MQTHHLKRIVVKIYIKTFGCRTNIYDSELIKNYIKEEYLLTQNENEADAIIINSCTVTNNADVGLKQYILSTRKKNPKARFILTGCAANSIGEKLYKNNIVDSVVGASLKQEIPNILKTKNFFDIGNLNFIDDRLVKSYEQHTKAFVKIQEGCDFNCSYCIIPSVRGRARSIQLNKIINEIRTLSENGFSEIVLTGTNIGSYGKDINTNLAKLIKEIFKINNVRRLRLGSIEPVQINDEFKELLDEKKLEKHLHIALQHTNEQMLRLMQRRNTALKDLKLFDFLASKNYALGTDFIVAHPGESDEIWQDAIKKIYDFPLTHIHAFVYSKRDGTKSVELAKQLGEIPKEIAKQRLKYLRQIIADKNYKFRQKQGQLDVLIEQKKDSYYTGYDQFFNLIKIKSKINLEKKWLKINDYEVGIETNSAIIKK